MQKSHMRDNDELLLHVVRLLRAKASCIPCKFSPQTDSDEKVSKKKKIPCEL